ncbi:MAG: MBL fold metallo-hydrolase [Thermincola sp.]|jgi:flavorubredoxin|nr:MBL fold metallo-hydrolase [Thermincola sp.]MDT3704627.1 MBL fold metallo-hydrolase [Thermincola sp.]
MEKFKVLDDLYLFRSYNKFIDLTFNQYLLIGEAPLLIHTGTKDVALELLPELKNILGNRSLSYIFVSHFEADECGGLSCLLEQYPEAKTVCSMLTARQFTGFGLVSNAMAVNPGEFLSTGDFELKFVNYPSEIHLKEGLMAFEEKRGLLFSSDLFTSRGQVTEAIVNANWQEAVNKLSLERIPSPTALKAVQQDLINLAVKVVAPGHGPCIRV